MKKLIKSRWAYVIMFVLVCILAGNIFLKAAIEKNVKEQKSVVPEHKVINTKTIYEYPEEEVSISTKVEDTEPVTQTKQDTPKEDESFTYPAHGRVISKFSGNNLVYSETLKEYRVHNGIDISAAILSQVFAIRSGVVESVKKEGLMGITIVIDHGGGFKSVYSNLSSGDMVKEGQSVRKGEIISGVGDTALIETGMEAHLHFELIKDGVQVNPEEYIK